MRTEDPVALLLVRADVRRPTGQRLPAATEAMVLRDIAGSLRKTLLASDRVVQTDDGDIGIILLGANVVGAEGVAHRLARRLDALRAISGRDVRVQARIAFSMFPDEGSSAEVLIRRAQRRIQCNRKGGVEDPNDCFEG